MFTFPHLEEPIILLYDFSLYLKNVITEYGVLIYLPSLTLNYGMSLFLKYM